MTESTVLAPFFAANPPPDPRHPAFNFTAHVYVEKPDLIPKPNLTNEAIEAKLDDDKLFRRSASQTAWHRYVTLGYQTTPGRDFAKLWTERYAHTLRFQRAIWYNYLSYVDHGKDVPEKLHYWATQVAQPYLILHDSASLDMDTDRFSWRALIANLERHESLSRWLPVGKPQAKTPRSSTPPLTQPAAALPVNSPGPMSQMHGSAGSNSTSYDYRQYSTRDSPATRCHYDS